MCSRVGCKFWFSYGSTGNPLSDTCLQFRARPKVQEALSGWIYLCGMCSYNIASLNLFMRNNLLAKM